MDNPASTPVKIALYDELPSTSDFLREHPELWQTNFYTVTAREQTAGHGRNGRSWLMQGQKDLAFTMVFHFAGQLQEAAGLTPFIGYALQKKLFRLLADAGRDPSQRPLVKWPNDILVAGKKICGILCEHVSSDENAALQIILIGAGINVNSTASANDAAAVSLKEVAGREFPLESLREDIIVSLAHELQTLKFPYSHEFCSEWYKSCSHPLARISWSGEGGAPREGIVSGIDDRGRLIVADDAQKNHHVSQDIQWL